jgi:hypothetical protein
LPFSTNTTFEDGVHSPFFLDKHYRSLMRPATADNPDPVFPPD